MPVNLALANFLETIGAGKYTMCAADAGVPLHYVGAQCHDDLSFYTEFPGYIDSVKRYSRSIVDLGVQGGSSIALEFRLFSVDCTIFGWKGDEGVFECLSPHFHVPSAFCFEYGSKRQLWKYEPTHFQNISPKTYC